MAPIWAHWPIGIFLAYMLWNSCFSNIAESIHIKISKFKRKLPKNHSGKHAIIYENQYLHAFGFILNNNHFEKCSCNLIKMKSFLIVQGFYGILRNLMLAIKTKWVVNIFKWLKMKKCVWIIQWCGLSCWPFRDPKLTTMLKSELGMWPLDFISWATAAATATIDETNEMQFYFI